MQRVWAFLHLLLLLTAAQGTAPVTKTTNTARAGVTERTTTNGASVTSGFSSIPNSTAGTTTTKGSRKSTSETNGMSGVLELLLSSVRDPPVLIAFGIGVVLTALVWGLTALCCRCKRKSSISETLEMVSTQAFNQSGQQDECSRTNAGAEEDGGTACSPEVEYSDINFSALKRQRPAGDVTRENTESEYAEIKREATEETEDGATEQGEGGEEQVEEDMTLDAPTQSLWTGESGQMNEP